MVEIAYRVMEEQGMAGIKSNSLNLNCIDFIGTERS